MFNRWLEAEIKNARRLITQISSNPDGNHKSLTGQLRRTLSNLEMGLREQANRMVQATGWGFDLQRRKTYYQDLFNRAPVGYLILDRDMHILEANKSAASLLGCPSEEPGSPSLYEMNQPKGLDSLRKHYSQVISSRKKLSRQVKLRDEDGGERWLWVSSAPIIINGDNGIIASTMTDITVVWGQSCDLALMEKEKILNVPLLN